MIINERVLGLIELKTINEKSNVIEFIFGDEIFGQQNHFTLDDIIGYIYYFIKFYRSQAEFADNASIPKSIVGKTILIKFAFVEWMSSLCIGELRPYVHTVEFFYEIKDNKNKRMGKDFYNYSCKEILKQTKNKGSIPVRFDENVSLDLKQEKWFKNLIDSNITVKDDTLYNLKATNNKRHLIYENGKLVATANKNVSDN